MKKTSHFKPKFAMFLLVVCILSLPIISAAWSDSLNTKLNLYYKLDETTGTTASNNQDTTVYNGTTLNANNADWVSAKIANGFRIQTTEQIKTNIKSPVAGNNYSYGFWINITGGDLTIGNIVVVNSVFRLTTGWAAISCPSTSHFCVAMLTGAGWQVVSDPSAISTNRWYYLVFTRNATSSSLYVNGTLVSSSAVSDAGIGVDDLYIGDSTASGNIEGVIDEFGFWNRTLSQAEVTQLYNSGAGITQVPTLIISSINAPADNSVFFPNQDILFNITAQDSQTNYIKNATLYINGTKVVTNTSLYPVIYIGPWGTWNILTHYNLTSIGNYSWFQEVCWLDDHCFNSTTKTFNISTVRFDSVTYNTPVLEGNVENFTLNITSATANLNSVSFIYNGTSYPVSIANSGTNYVFTSSITVPMTVPATNYTFYWTMNFGGTLVNSSTYIQRVLEVAMDDCTVNTVKLLNMSLLDEETQGTINGSIEITVNLYPTNQYPNPAFVIGNLSQKFTNVTNASVCLSTSVLNGTGYYMDAQIRYFSNGYVTKLYNIQKYEVTNTSYFQNIKLFNLATALNTNFLITVKDANFLPLQGALIMIQRKYVGEGVYKNVEIPLSDLYGQAVGHFNTNSVIYQIVIVKNGVNIATFTDIAVVCTDATLGQCYLNLNAASSSVGFDDYATFDNLNYVLTTNTTGSSILTFNTISGISATMNITTMSYGLGSVVLCSSSLLSSAGTITCNMPSTFTNGTIEVSVYKDGQLITTELYSISLPISARMGYEGYIYLLLLIITIPFMFITDTIGFMVAIVIGFVIAGALFLYGYGSLIGTGSALVWLIVAVGAIVYKLSERRREM